VGGRFASWLWSAAGCDLALLFPANFSFEMACWLTVEKYQDFTQASLPLKHRPSLIPVIPFYAEIQLIRETVETVPEERIRL
jgi:hypothetical protein